MAGLRAGIVATGLGVKGADVSNILEAYLHHEKAIKKYLYRFFSRSQDVEDIAHEAFIKVFATELRGPVLNPKALLFRAAKHSALSELAKKSNTTTSYMEETEDKAVFLDRDGVGAEDIHDSRRKLATLSMAVSQLPPVCRKVFILRKIEGLSMKEVAEKLGIAVSTAEKHAAQGLIKCSNYMREHGYDPQEFGETVTRAHHQKITGAPTREKEPLHNGD
ncbi:RNA polymerase sigma factor [Parvularcula flava]|uniref:RNA polymerase sigma factor n=1 Tax=Aquisalinus luteolus TaxID=1566827 RepID=A0ABX0HT99_9PROT|nr:RNA polymerase sigma factor [Aquisalinus luteolus]NHK29666.1 RNA polymerase sigma factor [Aquisalinus luteolus]